MYSNQSKGRHASKGEGELQSNEQSVSRLMPKNVKTIEAVFSLLSCPSWHVQHRYHEQQTGLLSPLHVSFLPATLCPYAQALPPISLHSFFQSTRLPPLSNPHKLFPPLFALNVELFPRHQLRCSRYYGLMKTAILKPVSSVLDVVELPFAYLPSFAVPFFPPSLSSSFG